ncbi:hypothetical protein I0C86_41225 [Plantactinospora sp. S1510]|uniref:Uncharacterized protein n=1 Tax=Plantactinospora alkalitolerans TaxID=2789879 RepID=A0ABS0H9W6_9ACTN|nr:hypothetical protein [Plantactinospora alkalitolerans]MBF9135275.1 hypothetical protein [Plantactinospora alkalitolerans]
MRYMVRTSVVRVIGRIWQPGHTAGQDITLTSSDVDNARDDNGKITRESVGLWLDSHAGDFAEIIDFEASVEDGDATIDIPWADEESEMTYNDCMCPAED